MSLWWALAACRAEDPVLVVAPVTEDPTTTEPVAQPFHPTSSTMTTLPPDLGGFRVQWVDVWAQFGWDALTRSVVTVHNAGVDVPSAITIALMSTTEACTITLSLADGPAEPAPQAAADDTVLASVQFAGTVDDVATDCDDEEHPVDDGLFGPDLVDGVLNASGLPWGLAIGALTDTAAFALWKDYGTWTYDEYVGGRVYNAGYFFAPTITDDDWYAYGQRIDQDYELVLEDGLSIPIRAQEMAGGLPSGHYVIRTSEEAYFEEPF